MLQRKSTLHLARYGGTVAVFAVVGLFAERNARAEDRVPKSNAARQVTGPVGEAQQLAAGTEATLEFRLTPMVTYPGYPGGTYNTGGAYDQSNISGQTLHVTQGGFVSYWNVQFANWDPDPSPPHVRLRGFQASVHSGSFSSGSGAPLTAPALPCSNSVQCIAIHGESGATCLGGTCSHCWRNRQRQDGLDDPDEFSCWEAPFIEEPLGFPCEPFRGLLSERDPNLPPPVPCGMVDPNRPVYAGTVALYVPPDAYGTYTIDFLEEETFAVGVENNLLPLAGRLPGVLIVDSGACCREVSPFSTVCEENVGSPDCACAGCTWHDQTTCAEAGCAIERGACCDSGSDGPQMATCNVTTIDDCTCEKCTWTPQTACANITCDPNFTAIPATSQWGLAVLTLVLLIGGKVYFGRRPALA